MSVALRPARSEDLEDVARICFGAFGSIARTHGFPQDFPSLEAARASTSALLGASGSYGLVAERDGVILGSAFIHDRDAVAAIGPVSVDPATQDGGVGRLLMEGLLRWGRERGFQSTRLIQAGYHMRSLALYSSLGFDARESLSAIQGPPIPEEPAVIAVRPATLDDIGYGNELCALTHGFARGFELAHAVESGSARVAIRNDRVTGYAADISFIGHAVAETNEDLKALIAAAPVFGGPGFLVPTRNGDLLRWCLSRGLRIVAPFTLMTIGAYQEPRGPYLPSIAF